jgi:hypothetical protein
MMVGGALMSGTSASKGVLRSKQALAVPITCNTQFALLEGYVDLQQYTVNRWLIEIVTCMHMVVSIN